MLSADKANIPLLFKRAAAIDLAWRDVLAMGARRTLCRADPLDGHTGVCEPLQQGAPPVAKVLQEQFGIVQLFITTVHAYTSSQSIMDKPTRKRRHGRAGALSMIPTTTGAAQATALVLPELAGKMDGMAIRVPIPDGSVTDIVVQLEKATTASEINACLRAAAQRPRLQGMLAVGDDERVSVDMGGTPHSSIVDAPSTIVLKSTTARILAWCDNEWGYSCRPLA